MFVPFSLGRYTVVGAIRYGGMGEVLRAQRVEEDGTITTWAVKRPLPTIVEDPELLGLFWKETELMQRLHHPGFPRVEEVGVAQGIPFLTMEHIDGATVQEILRRQPAEGGVRPEAWVLMARDLAMAVGELHRFKREERVLVHGDIRSSNVMVEASGAVRVVDLGLALANDRLWQRMVRTKGVTVPPFLEGRERSREIDTAGVARVLAECLGGQAAVFGEESRAPRGLAELIRKALDPSGLYAYKSARALRWELQSYLVQDKMELMRAELAAAARGVTPSVPAAGGQP